MRDKAAEYLNGKISYRQVVRHRGMPILYDDRDGSSISAKQDGVPGLAPSTVWRWLSWWGSLQNIAREAGALMWRKAPSSVLHREGWPIAPEKHRSDKRKETLQRATQLLVIDALFEELFHEEIFPNFATAHGWC